MADYRQVAAQKAQQYGVPVNVFLRQIQQESGFNPNARSGAGAQGIAQFIPSTARSYGLTNPYDPVASLDAAARFDRDLIHRYGTVARALSAYNSGNPDAYRNPGFAGGQTYNYVRDILAGATGGTPAAQTAVQVAPGVPAPRPQPVRAGLSPDVLAILNQGNRMFGLPALPPSAVRSAPSRLPTAGPSPSPAAPPTPPTPVKGPSLKWLEHFAAPFGLTVTSTTGGQHAPHSYHYQGRAVDFGGDPGKMAQLSSYALQHPGQFKEMFYTGPGHPNFFISDGKVMPLAQLDPHLYQQHLNHVHLAR